MPEQATTIILQARPIDALAKHYNAPKGGIFNYSPEYDGSGFRFEPWIENNGNPPGESHIYCRKVDQAGNEAGRWEFTLPPSWKPDDVSNPTATLQAGQTLADVVFGVSGHFNILDAQGNAIARDTKPFLCVIPAVWVPRPGEMGVVHNGPNGFVEGVSTGGTDVDYEQIARIVDSKLATFAERWGDGGDIRQSEENKAKDAFRELFTDTDTRGQQFRAQFEQFLQTVLINIWKKNSADPDALAFQARFDQDVRDRAYEADVSYGGPKQGPQQQPQQGQGEPSK